MFWWIGAGVLVVLELFSGTFYLLMIALGCVAAALAHAGGRCRPTCSSRWPPWSALAAVAAAQAFALWPPQARGGGAQSGRQSRHRPDACRAGVARAPGARAIIAARHGTSNWRRASPKMRGSIEITELRGSCLVVVASRQPNTDGQPRPERWPRHANTHNYSNHGPEGSNGFNHRRGSVSDHRDRAGGADHQDRAAAACVGGGAARPLSRDADAGLELRVSVRRPDRVQAHPQGNSARSAEPGLHHARQHAVAGGRHAVLPGHRPDEGVVRVEQLRVRDHAVVADHAALGDRQAGTRQDLRGARLHQPQHRVVARRSGGELGREGAALRDQGSDAAEGNPARDAGADHRRAREARADRRVGRAQAGADQYRVRRPRGGDPEVRRRAAGGDQSGAGPGVGDSGGGRGATAQAMRKIARGDSVERRDGSGESEGGRTIRERVRQSGEAGHHADRAGQSGGHEFDDRVGADDREQREGQAAEVRHDARWGVCSRRFTLLQKQMARRLCGPFFVERLRAARAAHGALRRACWHGARRRIRLSPISSASASTALSHVPSRASSRSRACRAASCPWRGRSRI